MKTISFSKKNGWLAIALILTAACSSLAQTTDFTYQGKLTDVGTPSASYDFEFRLCDSSAADCSAPLDSNSRPGVAVSNGVFTVTLNFGAANFSGADRFLETRVKRPGETIYTTLAPRQKITSAPYAIQARNAENANLLSGFTINQLVLDSDTRLNPNNYIQNTNTAQPSANFSIGGSGTANILNATTQFNLGGARILSGAGTDNLFVGVNAGAVNAAGTFNSFFGTSAGGVNTSGRSNSFFGSSAGQSTTTGINNTFVGAAAGGNNNGGNNNTAIGFSAGGNSGSQVNSTAVGANAFVTADNSLVLGSISGVNNATANTNVGIGTTAPSSRFQIADGGGNIFFSNSGCPTGFAAIAFVTPLTRCTNYAMTGGNGSTYLNRQTGGTLFFRENNADQMVIAPGGNVGIGSPAPTSKLDITGTNSLIIGRGTSPYFSLVDSTSGKSTRIRNVGGNLLFYTNDTTLNEEAAITINDLSVTAGTLRLSVNGNLEVKNFITLGLLASGGTTQLCRNNSNFISTCGSSLRYKTDLQPYVGGMNVVNRLQPITFRWKTDGTLDLGFGAETVAEIEPLLVTHNQNGQVEGLIYDRLSTVFVNALKEQQAEIETQKEQIKQQREEIEALKTLVCATNRETGICKEKR